MVVRDESKGGSEHTKATADYVEKTKGRAIGVMNDVYQIFPSMKMADKTKELSAQELEKQAKAGAERTFDKKIGAHIQQILDE